MTDTTLDLAEQAPFRWRRYAVLIGRVLLIAALIGLWKLGADAAGPLYVADPVKVFQRIVTDTQSGVLLRHIYVTMRLSIIGFAIGCFFGVALPFVLRRMPRLTAAIEPYIMASVGIPKDALIPLFILYFGIDDAPKLWLIGLLVFYPIFIAIFAGIRNVDRRLINMALPCLRAPRSPRITSLRCLRSAPAIYSLGIRSLSRKTRLCTWPGMTSVCTTACSPSR